jgi:hypothetical protein
MSLANYSDLKSAIASWTARSDLTTQLDDFIDMAEAEFNRTLRTEQMITETTLTLSSTSASVNLPSDFLEIDSISFTDSPKEINFLARKSLQDQYAAQTTGRPRVYSLRASSTSAGVQRMIFGPAPDGAYTLTISYYQKVPGLSTSNTTNWLMTKEPEAYLFCSLSKGLSFIQDTERKAEIKSGWMEIKSQLDSENERRKMGGAGTVVRTDISVV